MFTFQPHVCNCCHDMLMLFVNLNNIAILNTNGADYHCIIYGISKINPVNLLQNANLRENQEVLQK